MYTLEEKIKLFNYIIQHENIPISRNSLFPSKDIRKVAEEISSKETFPEWKLSREQIDYLVNYFCNYDLIFNDDTPSLLKNSKECILNAAKNNIKSINGTSITKNNRNIIDDLVELAIKNNYILVGNSPQYLKRNFKVALNSAKLDPSSAGWADERYFSEEEKEKFINHLLSLDNCDACQIIDSRYMIESNKRGWRWRKDDNLAYYAKKNKDLFKYLEDKGYTFEEDIFHFNLDVLTTSNNLESFVKRVLDKYLHNFACIERQIEGIKVLQENIPSLCKIIRAGFSTPLTVSKIKTFFGKALEEEWYDNLVYEPYPNNIANKIISYLKDCGYFTSFLYIEEYLNILKKQLTHEEYKELLTAMQKFAYEYNKNETYSADDANIIFKSEKLFLEREKENYIKTRYYEIFGPILIPKKDKGKYYDLNDRRNSLKKIFSYSNGYLDNIIKDVSEKYKMDKVEEQYLRENLDCFEGFLYGKDDYNEQIPIEEDHIMYQKEKTLYKIIRWLNCGKIDINNKTISYYLNYIRERDGVYYDRWFNLDLPDKVTWEEKERIYKIYKEVLEEAYYKAFEGDYDTYFIGPFGYIPKDIPFDDEHFEVQTATCIFSFIKELLEVSTSDLKGFLDNADKYEEYLKRTSAFHFILANDNDNYFRGKNKECDCNMYEKFYISRLINNYMKKDYIKTNNVYELFGIANRLQYIDEEGYDLLGDEYFHKVVNQQYNSFGSSDSVNFKYLTIKNKSIIPFVKGSFENYKYENYTFSNGDFIKDAINRDLSPSTLLNRTNLESNDSSVIRVCDSFDNYIGTVSVTRRGNGISFGNFIYNSSDSSEVAELEDIFNLLRHIGEEIVLKTHLCKDDKTPI